METFEIKQITKLAKREGQLSWKTLEPLFLNDDLFTKYSSALVDALVDSSVQIEYFTLAQRVGKDGLHTERSQSRASRLPLESNPYIVEVRKLQTSTREDEILLAKEIEFARKRFLAEFLAVAKQTGRKAYVNALKVLKASLSEGTTNVRFEGDKLVCELKGGDVTAAEWINKLSPAKIARLRSVYDDLQDLKSDLVRANLYLVVHSTRRFKNQGMEMMDLIQEGNTGLLRAVEKYNWRRGFRFQTYATWWILEAIKRALYNHSRLIRVPIYLSQKLDRRQGQTENVDAGAALKKKSAAPRQEAASLRVPGYHTKIYSLDQSPDRHDDLSFIDAVEDTKVRHPIDLIQEESLREKLNLCLDTLQPREREILEMRFGLNNHEPQTLEEISHRFNVSRERIRQIQEVSLRKLKNPLRIEEFADMLQ